MTLEEKLTTCKLSGIQKSYERIIEEAQDQAWSYREFFERLIDEEIISRENNRFNRLYKKAKFPNLKTIDERMTTAIIDRLIHNSFILTFNGESYRYRQQKEHLLGLNNKSVQQ